MSGVVVTGGTGALGRAVVRLLLRQRARVAVPFRGRAAFEALKTDTGAGDALWGRSADLALADDATSFFADAAAWAGGLDGLAALAGGFASSGTLDAADPGEWAAMMRANLEPTYHACRAALPHLLAAGGSVVTVASRTAEAGGAGAAAYAVSKAGVLALTRALALENGERGVRFNCVSPGTIDTPQNRSGMPRADASTWTPPEDIARVIVFLLSPDSAPVTGAVLPVDGPAQPSRPKEIP